MRLLLLVGINKVPLMDLISINPQINLKRDYLRTYNLYQEKGGKFKKPTFLFSEKHALLFSVFHAFLFSEKPTMLFSVYR